MVAVEWQAGLVVKIVWAVAAVLLGITGWLIVTGRHHRYYKNAILGRFNKKMAPPPDGVPPGSAQRKGTHRPR